MKDRKKEHIELASKSQTKEEFQDKRFVYEPLLSAHPNESLPGAVFAGKKLRAPLWISSMTGGTDEARTINKRLANTAVKHGLGMGLGSCRKLLDDKARLADFDMRPILGAEVPLFANLGIAQVEKLVLKDREVEINQLLKLLDADGLMLHVNPLQEWFQPEGDRLVQSPIETIKQLLAKIDAPVVVKEVGQGMGPESLRALLRLPLEGIEFGAFGGTNFARLEMLRNPNASDNLYNPLVTVGNTADDMLGWVNEATEEIASFSGKIIISGGVRTYLDAYYYLRKSKLPALVGMASGFLKPAREGQQAVDTFTQEIIEGLRMAYAYVSVR
ncbi:MAG: isopentenyl-diphosphate delta-isomerase [Bacteroidota bacterium]